MSGARAATIGADRRDASGVPPALARRAVDVKETVIRGLLFLCSTLSIVTTIGIVLVLALESSYNFV